MASRRPRKKKKPFSALQIVLGIGLLPTIALAFLVYGVMSMGGPEKSDVSSDVGPANVTAVEDSRSHTTIADTPREAEPTRINDVATTTRSQGRELINPLDPQEITAKPEPVRPHVITPEPAVAYVETSERPPFFKMNRRTRDKVMATPEYKAAYKKWNNIYLSKLKEPDPIVPIINTREHTLSQRQVQSEADKINRLIANRLDSEGQRSNKPTTEEQFVRRIYLQIAGRIPTHEETLAFLKDSNHSKRQALIDDLLLRIDYRMQMFNWLADMLRVRDMHALHGMSAGYQAWLIRQVATNRPWDEIVFDLLTAEGNMITNPETGWLIRDKGMPLDGLANTMTTFMGASVGCAQCHDHPIEVWTQREFYELAAFFGAMDVPGRDARSFGGDRSAKNTVAPTGASLVHPRHDHYLTYPDDYKYNDVEPSSKVTPRFAMFDELVSFDANDDLRKMPNHFATWMTHPDNKQFARAIANRLWGKAFGRAIIENVTEVDHLRKASDPALMQHLSDLIRELDYDMMTFQRIIYNTRAYQAQTSITPPPGEPYYFPGPLLQRMTAEQTWDSMATLAVGDNINDAIRPRLEQAQAYDVFVSGSLADLSKDNAQWHQELFKQATDIRLKYRAKAQKLGSGKGFKFARASEMRLPAEDAHFLRMFGQSNKELADDGSLESTIPQILMLMNGRADNFLTEKKSHFYQQMQAYTDPQDQLDSLYLSFLSRPATEREKQIIKQNKLNVEEIAWILLNTREFMFIQ